MADQVQGWVEEALQARALRRRLAEQGHGTAEVDAALDGLYRDIGRSVVDQRGRSAADQANREEGSADGWYTEDAELPSGRLFDPGDLGEPSVTDIPTPEDLNLPPEADELDGGTGNGQGYAVETLASAARRAADPTSFLGIARVGVSTWRPDLDRLLDMLRGPQDLSDPRELAVETNRLRWATAELPALLASFPDEVKVALLGLLGARLHQLRARADADVSLRIALDRLQRFRVERGLPTVPALLPTPLPERGSWMLDSEAWWAVFRPPRGSS